MEASSASDKLTQRALLRMRKICVVIPTYNNGGTIGKVVRETLVECQDVIVVDDGCTDDTQTVLSAIEGITVVRHGKNRGKGRALKSGFAKAKELGFAYVITLDGDGQHYPKDIANILSANIEHPEAIIIGSRKMNGVDRSGGSDFANKFSNFWFNLQTGRMVSDTQSGYRLYPLKKLHLLLLVSSRYEAELSLMVFASWHGAEIKETPIDVYYPPREERVSHFRPFMDFTRISILNTILCVMAVAYGLPLTILRFLLRVLRTAYSLLVFSITTLLIFTPLTWIYTHVGKDTDKKKMKVHKLMHHVARFVMIGHGLPGVKFKQVIAGGLNLDSEPKVIICNHQSAIDLLCMLCQTPKMIFLTKDWVRNSPFFGFIVRSADYPSSSEGIEQLIPNLKALKEKGYNIVIYPEGSRSRNGHIARYHQGAFLIAEALGMDIVPTTIYGTGRVLDSKTMLMRPGTIEMRMEKAVTRKELDAIGTTLEQANEMRRRARMALLQLTVHS